jgi:hypothetical protein
MKNILINRLTKSHTEKVRKALEIIPSAEPTKKIFKKEIN